MTERDPTIDGRHAVVLEAIDGGWCIAAKGIAAHLFRDGKWVLDSGDCSSRDEWVWPTREAAERFIQQHADKPSPTSASPLNHDHDESRALHRIVRAMHDGECPKCHGVSDASEMWRDQIIMSLSHVGQVAPSGWQCPMCAFYVTEGEGESILDIFAPFMERNLAVFEKWRAERDGTSPPASPAPAAVKLDAGMGLELPNETGIWFDYAGNMWRISIVDQNMTEIGRDGHFGTTNFLSRATKGGWSKAIPSPEAAAPVSHGAEYYRELSRDESQPWPERFFCLENGYNHATNAYHSATSEAAALREENAKLKKELDKSREGWIERIQFCMVGAHTKPEECPTWYDQCNCGIVKRLEQSNAKLKEQNDLYTSNLACCCDLINTWSRELGISECSDPYGDLELRNQIDKVWSAASSKYHERLRAAEAELALRGG